MGERLGALRNQSYQVEASLLAVQLYVPFAPTTLRLYETLFAALHASSDQLDASLVRNGGRSGTHRTLPHEDHGHGDDGRHEDGLLQRHEKPF